MPAAKTERVATGRTALVAESHGSGDPVLLIHGSIAANSYDAMIAEPAAAGCRYITYKRVGFEDSGHTSGPYSIADQAADAAAVLRYFGVNRAHVAGHSYGGAIALQMAIDTPELVQSLVLLEPALLAVPAAAEFAAGAAPAIEAHAAGDGRRATDIFMRLVGSDDYEAIADRTLPAGWLDRAVADIDTFFNVEFPALGAWAETLDIAGRITCPMLAVVGGLSGPMFQQGQDQLVAWFPQAERATLPAAHHFLEYQNPSGAAALIRSFVGRHPIVAK